MGRTVKAKRPKNYFHSYIKTSLFKTDLKKYKSNYDKINWGKQDDDTGMGDEDN